MAMSVHQTGHQQLSAVAEDAGTGILGCNCRERARFLDGAVHYDNCAGRDHTGRSEARIGDCIRGARDYGPGHDLAPLVSLRSSLRQEL
jgi:hypothetical protein